MWNEEGGWAVELWLSEGENLSGRGRVRERERERDENRGLVSAPELY